VIGRISKVRKRDGRLVDFDETKIADAIYKAACAVGDGDRFLAEELAGVVTLFLEKSYAGAVPGIEEIQDMVEKVLIETGHARMAKAYILYRERRARAREQVFVHGETGTGPLVGSPAKARVGPWQKSRIARALVREADLDEKVATEIASRVEAKVIGSGVERITTSAIRSLVETELFLKGYGDRVGRQGLVGLPRYDVDQLLRGGKGGGWRPRGPEDLKRALADAVLAQYALSEVYSAEVVDAHLDARLHVLDVGCPFEWVAAVADVPPTDSAESWADATTLQVGRLGGVVTRELTVSGVVPTESAWAADDPPGTILGAVRRLLGHSALRTTDPRGGRFRLAFAFPLLPGRALADAIVREHWACFRSGRLEGLPELVLHLGTEAAATEEGRRVLLPALAAAAETSRAYFAFDREEAPAVATPWYRLPEGEAPGAAALPVAGAVALNVAALLSPEGGAGGESDLRGALDEAVPLAVKALRQKRSFMEALQADPSAPLYRVAAGARPLVAGAGGVDLVHLVGVRTAAARLAGRSGDLERLARRLLAYASVRIAEEGRRVRLRTTAAPERDGEAARRFLEADRARLPGLPEGEAYDDREPYALPERLEMGNAEVYCEPLSGAVELRFPREAAPPPETLYDTICLLARDSRVRSVRFLSWPDRSVRAPLADL
jgi:hypothetical protein